MLALMVACAGGASADTYVDDSRTVSGEWNEAGSPYIVNETIYVPTGQTLTIGPNVTVLFGPGAGLVVNGTLVVEGNETHMVVFDEYVDGGMWYGLTFNAGSVGNIDYALINNTMAAIDVTNADVAVRNSQIINTWSFAPVFAEFTTGGSLTIDGCYIEALSSPEVPITVIIEAFAEGLDENVTAVDIAITNNVVNSTSPEGLLYIERRAHAVDNGIATIVGDILVSGNEFNLLYSNGNLAYFYDEVSAEDKAAAKVQGSITYTDNQAYTTSTNENGMTFFEREVTGYDNATASLVGNIDVSGNCFNQTSMSSDLVYVQTHIMAYDNATAEVEGDFTEVGNEMLQAGNNSAYLYTDIYAGGENSTALWTGDIVINDNRIENVRYGPYVSLYIEAEGYGEVRVVGDVLMNGNLIGNAGWNVGYYECEVEAYGNSAVSVVGDVYMNGNTADYADEAFNAYWSGDDVEDNATVEVSASLYIEDNCVNETYTAFDVWVDVDDISQDAAVVLQVDTSIRNNVIRCAYVDILYAYFGINSPAADRATCRIDASLLFEGNEAFCENDYYWEVDAAIIIYRQALACDEATSTVDVEVSILDNVLDIESYGGIYLGDYTVALDEATAELLGDVTIAGNTVTMEEMPVEPAALEDELAWVIVERDHGLGTNGTAVVESDVVIDCNDFLGSGEYGVFMRVDVEYSSVENTTLAYSGDLVVSGNSFEYCYRDAVRYVVNLNAYWYGMIDYDGAVTVEDNVVDYCQDGDVLFVRQRFDTADYSRLFANFPVSAQRNTVSDANGLLHLDGEYGPWDDSVLEFVGDVRVLDNVCDDLDGNMVRYFVDSRAYGNPLVTIWSALVVSGNTASAEYNAVNYAVALYAYGDACIDADMPLTVTGNAVVVGMSMVDADVIVDVEVNATVVLSNDVVVQANYMESGDFEDPIAPTGGKGWAGYGLKLFQYLTVDGYVVLSSGTIESEVLFDGNTIVGYDLVGMHVYRNAYAAAYDADATACIIGDVTAENNVLFIDGTGCGLTGGAEVYAYEEWGNATAVVDTLFRFRQNEMTMAYGHGIVVYSEDGSYDYEDYDDWYSATSTNALEFAVQNNCIHGAEWVIPYEVTAGSDFYAIYVIADDYVPVTVSGNTIDLVTGTGVRVVMGDVLVSNNDITVDEAGIGIWVAAETLGPYYASWDEDTVVVIENNRIAVGGHGIYVDGAPGVIIRNSQLTNTQGTGLYIYRSDDVLVQGTTVTGAETGIYAYLCFNLTVCGSEFRENDYGGNFDGLENSTVCDSKFVRNNFDGADIYRCDNLLVECCAFSYNGYDGAYFSDMDDGEKLVIRDCSFEENKDDGLQLSSCYDVTMWNGVFRNNCYDGIYADETYLVWNVDKKSDVKNNDVELEGAKIYVLSGGVLTLDCIDYFFVEGFDTNDAPVTLQDGWGRLQVNEGGSLVARNVYFDAYNFVLWVYGCMNMMDCFIDEIETVYLGPTSQAELTTTTIEDAHFNGIYIDDCSPVIRSCVIRYSYMDGIYIVGENAKPVITSTVILGNERGIYAYESCLDKVVDNVFLSNYVAGIYAEKVSGLIHDNVFLFNQKEIFLVDCDVEVKYNEIGYARLLDAQESLVTLVATVLMDLVDVDFVIGNGGLYDDYGPYRGVTAPGATGPMGGLTGMLGYALSMAFDDHIGIYAVDSSVNACGNEYGMLQYAFYAIGSEVVFSDVVKGNTFDIQYAVENSTRKLSIPFVVYDGIYAVDSQLTIVGACFQVVDDAVFLENSDATITNTVFEAGDFDLYLMGGAVAAVAGELDRYAIVDSSVLYWLYELTVTVKDQDGWGIGDVELTIKDALGKVWATGKTGANGVFAAFVPACAETADGLDDAVNPYSVHASYGDKASADAEVTMDGDTQLGMTMKMKKNSFFGMDPLVLGVVALVVIAVIVGALMLARKK